MCRFFRDFSQSVFIRIMLIFFVAMIPIVSLSYYVYFYGSNLTNKEIAKSFSVKSEYVIESLEKEVDRINYLLYNCMRDKDLNDLSALPDMDAFEKYLAVQRLTERIVTIKDSSLLLRDVTVSIRSLGYHLSAESGMLKIAGQEYEALWKTQKKSEAGIISYNHAHHIISYPVLYENGTQTEPPFVIDAVLSDQAIVEQIHATAIQDDAEICFTDKNKQLLFYDGKENAEIFDEYIQQINQGANLPTSELTFNKVLGKKVNASYVYSDYFDMMLLQIVTDNIYLSNLAIYRWILILLTIITVGMIILFSAMIYRTIQKPIVKLLSAIEQVRKGIFSTRVTYRCSNELQLLIDGFNHMLDSIEMLMEKVYKQEILTRRAELKQLQAQIDPHFLFNSFFMLKTMLKCGYLEEADQFIQHLGSYYQYVTHNENEHATLEEELEHAIAYSNIQMMRFKRSFEVQFGTLASEWRDKQVPRLILQPFIENTIEHGIKNNRKKTLVQVSFENHESVLIIRISDTGGAISAEQVEKMNALLQDENSLSAVVNIHHRLRIMYGTQSGVRFELNQDKGLTAILEIDFSA